MYPLLSRLCSCLLGPVLAACALSACESRSDASPQPVLARPALGATTQAPSAAPPSLPEPAGSATNSRRDTLASRPRVYAKTRFVWIRPEPDSTLEWIGYLWIGGSVELKSDRPYTGPGCQTWYAIKPRGYVCVDGQTATLDGNDPVFLALRPYAPNLASPWPHHYAESRDAERYRSIPNEHEQRQREWDLEDHLKRVALARAGQKEASLDGIDLTPASAKPIELGLLPPTIYENRTRLRRYSTVAYSAETEAFGRSWLLSHDFMWIPKDRVAPYPTVEFQGVELNEQTHLPLAFFRGKARPKYRKNESGELVETGDSFARLSFVALTDTRETFQGDVYRLTREAGVYIKEKDAVIPTPRGQTPWGAPVFGEDKTGITPPGRATWIEASVWKGWLIAYEGTKPVFTTMISPGRGGTPVPDKDPLITASTPTGTFKISGKFATATMEAPNEFIHSDVPWTQNFSGPHAIHGAYWHDDWGNRKSAGCVNVSPKDGRWLFHFTEPVIPEGWHGLRWEPRREPATTFVVHD